MAEHEKQRLHVLWGQGLPKVKSILTDKGMVTSNTKEQLYSPYKGVLELWRSTHPTYPGQATNRSKDLGTTQRGAQCSQRLAGETDSPP